MKNDFHQILIGLSNWLRWLDIASYQLFRKYFPKREPKPAKRKFVKIGNRLVEFVPPPDHIPQERIEAMQKRARALKIKYPQMSLERIQRKVCEEFKMTVDTSQTVERIEVEGSGAIIKRMEKK